MSYHEPVDELDAPDRDLHRALLSLKEEVEAVDWYHQRWATATDPALKAILAHNRDEEVEHACMTLEWLRRISPRWRDVIATYLYTTGPITEVEKAAKDGSSESAEPSTSTLTTSSNDAGLGSLGIGQLGTSIAAKRPEPAPET